MSEEKPTKKERREEARAERIAAEQASAEASARKRRLGIFGALLVAAVAVVAVAIALSSGGDDKKSGEGLEGVDKVAALYKGIPQDGITLGDPKAKATVVVFVDAQCPFCRDFDLGELPGVVEKKVRTGDAKLVLRTRAFLGEDSIKGANAINAAGEQDKAWNVSGILYHNQGEENTGWLTDEKLDEILAAVPGLDAAKVKKAAGSSAQERLLGEAETLAKRYGSQSTPDIYVGTSENDANKVDPTEAAIIKAIDEIKG